MAIPVWKQHTCLHEVFLLDCRAFSSNSVTVQDSIMLLARFEVCLLTKNIYGLVKINGRRCQKVPEGIFIASMFKAVIQLIRKVPNYIRLYVVFHLDCRAFSSNNVTVQDIIMLLARFDVDKDIPT